MSVATKIKEHISDKGIKQTFLSEKTGLSENQLNLSLNDKRKLAIEEYVKICDALGVGIETFIVQNNTA